MIDRVLDRMFVYVHLLAVVDELIREPPSPPVRDIDDILDEVQAAAERTQFAGELTPADRKTYLPSDPVVSCLQTVLEESLRDDYASLLEPIGNPGHGEIGSQRNPTAWPLATDAMREDVPFDFTVRDPRWVTKVAGSLARRLARDVHPFNTGEPLPVQVDDRARIILVGDWGTGHKRAAMVAGVIRGEIDGAGDREVHVVHLGDVYYSGEPIECTNHFLDHWPVEPNEADRIGSWILNANHDMYCGGQGYFNTILGDGRFHRQRSADGRPTSYFRLANTSWQFLGLDTAWSPKRVPWHLGKHGNLQDPQGSWAERWTNDAGRRRTVLLSHHQLFSRHGRVRGNLCAKLEPVLRRGVKAWFWGHEHRCMSFARRDEVHYPRCVGHGAVPERAGRGNPEDGAWEYDVGWKDRDGDDWRYCGVAVLDLAGPTAHVRYINERAFVHHWENLQFR